MSNHGFIRTIALILFASFISCGGLSGEFAFRMPYEDVYKKKTEPVEFPSTVAVDWVFAFDKVKDNRKIGVLLMKKELVWVEIKSRTDNVSREKTCIYDRIAGLKDGEYRIVLTDLKKNNRLIGSKDFIIYSREEDEE